VVGSVPGRPALWKWEEEGGALAASPHDPPAAGRRTPRLPQDTPEGCLAMAAADMARASLQDAGWPRIRFEHSAQMWTRRAKLLGKRAQG
jgi:hypothetical protein